MKSQWLIPHIGSSYKIKFKMKLYISIFCIVLYTSLTFSQNNTLDKKKDKLLIIYGSNSCHYCLDTKLFLEEKNIEFLFYDIDVNKKKLIEMLNKLRSNGIDTSQLQLPVVDKSGKLFMNDKNFQEFLKKLIQ